MWLILLVLLSSSVNSFDILNVSTSGEWQPTREYYRLTKVLGQNITQFPNVYQFNDDFYSEIARYNFSDSNYAETCYNAYIEMKPSPLEITILEHSIRRLMQLMKSENFTDHIPEEWIEKNQRSYSIIFSRREAIETFSEKALSETKTFMLESHDKLMEVFVGSLTSSDKAIDNNMNAAIKQIALKYKLLSKNVKIDIERAFCARNTLRWLNYDTNFKLSGYFELFSDVLGLNIQNLIEDNDFLSNVPFNEVKRKYKERADYLNIPAQEYVDTCAEIYSVMKMTEHELYQFNQTIEELMGKEWGKKMYINDYELLEVLNKENAPFIQFISKRWNFVNSRLTNSDFQKHLKMTEGFLLGHLRSSNNAQVSKETKEKLRLSFEDKLFTYVYRSAWHRELEHVFCVKSVLESLMEQEITIENF